MKLIRIGMSGVSKVRPALIEGKRGPFWAVTHGEQGRGRWQIRMPLAAREFPVVDPTQPPDLSNEDLRMVPIGQDSQGNPVVLLTRAPSPDGTFLVLWDLSPGFRGSAWGTADGQAKVLASGRQAQGLAGRMGGAECPVVLVTGPCRLRWHRTGRLYGSPADWVAEYDGHDWSVTPADQCGVEDAVFEY